MGKQSRKVKQPVNPWNNINTAVDMMAQMPQYAHLPKPVLQRCWYVWKGQKSMNEKERNTFFKKMDKLPDYPTLDDFEEVKHEYKCVEVENKATIEEVDEDTEIVVGGATEVLGRTDKSLTLLE